MLTLVQDSIPGGEQEGRLVIFKCHFTLSCALGYDHSYLLVVCLSNQSFTTPSSKCVCSACGPDSSSSFLREQLVSHDSQRQCAVCVQGALERLCGKANVKPVG